MSLTRFQQLAAGEPLLREKDLGAIEYRECLRSPSERHLSHLARLGRRSKLGLWGLGLAVRHAGIAGKLVRFASRIAVVKSRAFGATRTLDRLTGAAEAAGGWDALCSFLWKTLPILVYHHVGPRVPGTFRFLTVEPAAFARQLDWLRKSGFTTIHPREWVDWLNHGEALPKRPILITFDDGYEDITTYALPALQARGMQATVYIVTGLLGGVNSWDSAYVQRQHSLMSAEQIRYWYAHKIDIGCHTRTHRRLVNLEETELEEEIDGSARDLTALLNRRADSFAYPYGEYSQNVAQGVAASFPLAVTTRPGVNDLWTLPHLLRRANVDPQHAWFDFPFLTWLGWGPYERTHAFLASKKRILLSKLRNWMQGPQRHPAG